ncbi:MAG: Sec-dependent nitrous-oxide reductase, partial [Gemmatimonadaceae bacterium]
MATFPKFRTLAGAGVIASATLLAFACAKRPASGGLISADAAKAVYVAPGQYDEFYAFMSGGFNGQIGVYGLPSGRRLKTIPVFSQYPENGYGYSEETKPMLNTSYGFVPWDDTHHPALSQTNGEDDGRWLFINANNTPRIARIDLRRFETEEILEIPNAGGNHGSPFITQNSEYVMSATRFSVPVPNGDVPIADFKKRFRGQISFIRADQPGKMAIAFQMLVPGFDYDLARAGKGPSNGWVFFSTYNTEQANSLLEVNASQNDKDFIAAVNWKAIEACAKAGKLHNTPADYVHNYTDEFTRVATSEHVTSVPQMEAKD